MNSNYSIDCIVRFHDRSRLIELERCFFSLVAQNYRPLKVILVLQRFTPLEIDSVHELLKPMFDGDGSLQLEICNFEHSEPVDARTHLLNLGLTKHTGRYLSFLDYDDVLYPEAYSLLIKQLKESDSAIAFAGVKMMKVRVYERFVFTESIVPTPPFEGSSLLDLFTSNFCPIHSYLIDLNKIKRDYVYFDTALTIEEDYEFLLRICAQYASDFSLCKIQVGYYFSKMDGSNTVAQFSRDESLLSQYEEVCEIIEKRRNATTVSPEVQRALGIQKPQITRSIRDILDIKGGNY